MRSNLKTITAFVCLFVASMLLASCGLTELYEKHPIGTKIIEYVGKYEVEDSKMIGKTRTSHSSYHIVFKVLSAEEVTTPIEVEVTETMYNGVNSLEGSLEAKFYRDGLDNVSILIGDNYFAVEGYSPKTANSSGIIADYDFVDQLYVPHE